MISAVYSMNDSYEGFQYTTDMTFDKFMEGWNECGTSLDMFAYVSGMTAEEFSKAWQEDATSAFMAFIKGLSSQSTADQLTIFDVLDIKQMREIFTSARGFKPEACRSESFETYLIGLNKK